MLFPDRGMMAVHLQGDDLPSLRKWLYEVEDERTGANRRAQALEWLLQTVNRVSPANAPVATSSSLSLWQRNLMTVCLEEPHGFPEPALQQLWSWLAESPAASEGWTAFLHDMSVYQRTWMPVVDHQRSRKRPRLPGPSAGEEVAAMVQTQDEHRGEGAGDDVKPTQLPDAALLEEAGRQLDLLDTSPLSAEAMDAACREAMQHLLRQAPSAAAWHEALSLERRSDAMVAALCRTMASEEAASARDVQGFLAGGLVPRLRAMQGPASRVVAEGLEALARRRPKALVDRVLLPLLMDEGGVAWAQQEVCVRLIKRGAIPPAELEHLLTCLSGRSSSSVPAWDDATMAVLAAILACQPPLADASLLCLLERLDEEVAGQQHPPSAKVVALVHALVGRYRHRLAPHRALLQRVAARLNHPLIRAAVASLGGGGGGD